MRALLLSQGPHACNLEVRVRVRSARSAIAEVRDGRLVVHLRAPPVDGAANLELCRLIAKQLRLGRTQVKVASGEKSRNKRLELLGVTADEVRDRLRALGIESGVESGSKGALSGR